MKASRHATSLALLLMLLSCISWYFARSTPVALYSSEALLQLPDQIITGLNVRQYGEDGKLLNALTTPHLHHIPANDTHWLETPHLIVTQHNASVLDIQAKEATSLQGGDEISFNHQVIIHQQPNANTPESTLKTDALTYYPKKNWATTQAKVVYERQGSLIQSLGMNAWLDEQRVQLLQQAEIFYDPAQAQG